ncbi:MAG: cytochrome P450 [Actinomycetota bacterium]|nr:cytochrome P450 [Actinomycetota bacterium]
MDDVVQQAEVPSAGNEGDMMAMMDAATCRAPQAMYRDLRADAPVLRANDSMIVCTARSDIEEVLRCPEAYSSRMEATSLGNVRPLIPLQIDPPDHKQYRRILDPIFAPRQMALLEDSVVVLVHRLIDRFIERGACDLVADLSVPLPSEVFLTMLGLPLADLPQFLLMKDGIIRPEGEDEGDWAASRTRAAADIYAYFDEVITSREAAPRDDLVSRFLTTEVEGIRLTRHEILDICFLLLIAGLDTVSAALDCFFTYLAEHPAHRQELVDDPSLVPPAVEELLRWETPVIGVLRCAVADHELSGVEVRAGDQVAVLIGSANTDESGIDRPDEVDFHRAVNKHLAFGGGVHRCLGSHLARLELRVVLREFHKRIPDYRLAEGADPQFTPGIRAADRLDIRFSPGERYDASTLNG